MARGAKARGKRIAFGDRRKILWDHHSEAIFRGNPNVAPPGSDGAADLEWIEYYRGHRLYNQQVGDRWEWNYSFRATPGEVIFDEQELAFARHYNNRVVIEPNVPEFKTVAPNKQWPVSRYRELAALLMAEGHKVAQFCYPGMVVTIEGATQIKTPSFRHAIAVLARSALYIGPEGGLHHGSAAVGCGAIVLFGGFIPPSVTGYHSHVNLTGGAEACGSLKPCEHCRLAMKNISVDDVAGAATRILKVAA